MKKQLLSILVSLLLAGTSFSQQEGFFNVYEDQDKSWLVAAAIEAHDGGFIFSQYDEHHDSKGELVKLSREGNLVKRVVVDLFPSSSYNYSFVKSIYNDPQNPDLYLAFGQNMDVPNKFTRPFVIRFDDELDITYAKEVELPEQYRALESASCQMTRDGKFLVVYDIRFEQRRLYMLISPDGEVEKLSECHQDVGLVLGNLFEHPQGGRYGHYRESFFQPPSPLVRTRLFTLDENFDTISYKEFTNIVVDTLDYVDPTNYTVQTFAISNHCPSLKLLDDTTLLIYECNRENKSSTSGSSQHEYSTVLFKTDLEGNMLDYHIIGSWNDHYDLPAGLNSFDFAKNTLSPEKLLYTCNMELSDENHYYYYNEPNPIVVTKMDESFDVVWQRYYSIPSYPLRAHYILATSDGGCLVLGSGHKNDHYDAFALKVDSEGSVGMDDVSACPYLFYPNPAQDQLHLQYSPDVKPAQVEFYDMQGRLVRTQSQGLEIINLQGLAPGRYLMKVTLEDGKTYSDKVVKE